MAALLCVLPQNTQLAQPQVAQAICVTVAFAQRSSIYFSFRIAEACTTGKFSQLKQKQKKIGNKGGLVTSFGSLKSFANFFSTRYPPNGWPVRKLRKVLLSPFARVKVHSRWQLLKIKKERDSIYKRQIKH